MLKNTDRATCVEQQFSSFRVEEIGMTRMANSFLRIHRRPGWTKDRVAGFQKPCRANRPRPTLTASHPNSAFPWLAQVWGRKQTPEAMRQQILTTRILWSLPRQWATFEHATFAEAFHCNVGDAMVRSPEKRCQVW